MFKITGYGMSGIREDQAETPLAALTKAQILEDRHHCTGIAIDGPGLPMPLGIEAFAEQHGLERLLR